jgi:hypothetical protein
MKLKLLLPILALCTNWEFKMIDTRRTDQTFNEWTSVMIFFFMLCGDIYLEFPIHTLRSESPNGKLCTIMKFFRAIVIFNLDYRFTC